MTSGDIVLISLLTFLVSYTAGFLAGRMSRGR